MKFFEKINDLKKQAPTQRVEEIDVNRVKYDVTEIERRSKLGKPLTQAEYTALEKYKSQQISNRILRIAGLIFVLALVVLAVGCFLYPYSFLNLFGDGDKFYDCWNHVAYHLDGETVKRYLETGRWARNAITDYEQYFQAFCSAHDVTFAKDGDIVSGWLNLSEIMVIAFQTGTSLKCNFIVIGSWSIILLSTIGLIAIVVYAIYAITYNIKDLVNLIKHLIRGTGYIIGDVGTALKEQAEEVIADIAINKKSAKNKKTKLPEKTTQEEVVDEDAEIQRKMEAYKQEIAAEEKEVNSPKTEPLNGKNTADLSAMSDDELDKLLKAQH